MKRERNKKERERRQMQGADGEGLEELRHGERSQSKATLSLI